MKEELRNHLTQACIEIIIFVLLGLLLLGYPVINPKSTGFTFTIFGFSAVVLYHLRFYDNKKNFVLLGTLFSFFMVIVFKTNNNFLVLVRNLFWFICIGILVNYLVAFEGQEWFTASKLWKTASWFVGFIAVYILMSFVNIYIFGFYKLAGHINITFYLRQSVKLGGVLGLGLGLGSTVSTALIKKKPSAA